MIRSWATIADAESFAISRVLHLRTEKSGMFWFAAGASLSVIYRDAAGNRPSETGYRSTQNEATEPDPENKNPRITGG